MVKTEIEYQYLDPYEIQALLNRSKKVITSYKNSVII